MSIHKLGGKYTPLPLYHVRWTKSAVLRKTIERSLIFIRLFYNSFNTMRIFSWYSTMTNDDSTPWPWPAISYIDGFLMSALSSMLELVVSVECNCSCSIVMEFLNIWCVYCFIWWNKEESQKTVYFILILFLSLSNLKSVESSLYPYSFSNPHQVPAMSLLSTSNNISRENHQTEGS